MKRITSIFLVLAMILTLAPMNIFAADAENTVFSDMKATDYYAQAATALEQLDILAGYPDGTFGANKSITRAEMAAVVCRMIDKEADAEKTKGKTAFDDVSSDHWASGYINIASKEGIINGDGNGRFRPEDDVKHEEAIKMVVCALGYGDDVEVDSKDWSKGYLEVADEKGISDDLKGTKGKASTRGDIAVMTYNGLATDAENSKIPATPVASVKAGEYKGTQKVKLTTTTKDAEIYYTTDGTTPTVKSTKYTKDISVTKTTTLKAIAVKKGVVSKDIMSVDYTIKQVSAGGGDGGGSSSRPSTTSITAAELQVNGTAVSAANVGDTLTLTTTPAGATGTISWTVGGNELEVIGNAYTVTALDMGKTIKAQISGTGSYQGTVSAECIVANTTQVSAQDIMSNDVDSSPVVLTDAENTTFLDNEGNPITVDATSTFKLSIENPEQTPEEITAATATAVQAFVNNSSASEADLADVTAVAVDVNLSIDETAIHPVGDVTVTLSAQQLGLPEGTDLTNYTFSANHTNKNMENEIVAGTVVTINNIQYVRFELNGLSIIWIGNIPPRTVSFYNTEEDADNKVNSIGSVVVKFGDFTPTSQIPSPSRSGYLFCGWNYDMTRTPIISNLEVHALWIEGEKMPADNISVVLSEDISTLTLEVNNGLVSVDCEDPINLPSNLNIEINVSAPSNTVKYYVGTDAAVVAAFNNADEYMDANAVEGINFEIDVTDESGVIVPSSNTYYYKWIDKTGAIIAIEEIKVKIAKVIDTATSMEYTASVNRGIGTFEAYLIDNEDPNKNFIGYINNYLNGKATEGYTLFNNVSFDGYRTNYDFKSYDELKFVFTPFDGESYDDTDTVVVLGEYYSENVRNENWKGNYQIVDGKLIVTYPFNASDMNEDCAHATVSVNGNEQEIDISWHSNGYFGHSEGINCETWAEVLTALRGVSETKEYDIYCTDRSPIILSSSLTIPANVNIRLNNTPSFTVANGVTLTMTDNTSTECSSRITVASGNFVVANGGRVTSSHVGEDQGNRLFPSIRAENIIFMPGSNLTIPKDAILSMHHDYDYGDSEKGVLIFESGSEVNIFGAILIEGFDVVKLNCTFNSMQYTYFQNDEIDINGKINITADLYGGFELYGTVNVGENGSIVVNNTVGHEDASLEIYGPLTNKGNIELKGTAANAEIMNNGFANYNEGIISVARNCSIATSGTKFINTGIITGDGIIKATLGDDYTNYDDGIEYVEAEDGEYGDEILDNYVYNISDYSRYKYTHDPASTVDVILYLSEIINTEGGRCTVTIDAEGFPEN